MMSAELSTKTPQQWLKLALIPALLVALIVVLCWPSSSDDAVTEVISLRADITTAKPANASVAASPSKWPALNLEELIAFNPFDPPRSSTSAPALALPAESPEVSEVEIARRPSAPIGRLQAIYFDAQGAAAILDAKVIRVGDTLSDGRRIVEITSKGIKLEELQ